jgi:hypothetical protein
MNRFHIPSRPLARLLAAAMLSGLAACGGGSGSSTPNPDPSSAPGTPSPSAAPVSINLALSGSQEVPPNASAATGTGTFTFDPATRQFNIMVTTAGITSTAAHIHDGLPGVAGPILFPMSRDPANGATWTTSGLFTEEQRTAFLAGRYYVNVHSAAFPAGEIRAQIVPSAIPDTPGGY